MTSETAEKIQKAERSSKSKDNNNNNNGHPYDLQFKVFSTMFAAALVLDLVEQWIDHSINYLALGLFYVFMMSGCRLEAYLIFLVVIISYHLMYDFPGVPNHINLAIVVVGQHFLVLAYLYVKNGCKNKLPAPGEIFELLRPIVGLAVVITYVAAGFHKLNWDFLNPRASCSANFIRQRMGITPSHFAPFHNFKWDYLWNPPPRQSMAVRKKMLTNAAATFDQFINVSSIMTLAWEIGGGLALLFEKGQPIMMAYSLMMHLTLAPLCFYDFSAMIFSFYLFFIPDSYFKIYQENENITITVFGTISVARHKVYAVCPVIIAYFTKTVPGEEIQRKLGMVFIVLFGVLVEPIVSKIVQGKLPRWTKPFEFNFNPRWILVTHALMIFLGMSNYLGLRTGGTFSMFSNIQTEGKTSNHLFLGSNSLKVWGYQEDMVTFIKADNSTKIRGKVAGFGVPLLEFQRKMVMWRQRSRPTPLSFEYAGKVYTTEDVRLLDEDFVVDKLDWRHYFMTFRKIQLDGKPTQCRW